MLLLVLLKPQVLDFVRVVVLLRLEVGHGHRQPVAVRPNRHYPRLLPPLLLPEPQREPLVNVLSVPSSMSTTAAPATTIAIVNWPLAVTTAYADAIDGGLTLGRHGLIGRFGTCLRVVEMDESVSCKFQRWFREKERRFAVAT